MLGIIFFDASIDPPPPPKLESINVDKYFIDKNSKILYIRLSQFNFRLAILYHVKYVWSSLDDVPRSNLSLSRSTVHRILKAHLKFRNVYSVWVPHVLSDSDDNKRQRIHCCKDIQKLFRTNARSFLGSHCLVQEESWIPWDFEDNRGVWIATAAVKPTTPRPKLTHRMTMVIVAYTSQPKQLSLTLLPEGATVNSGITKKFLDDTRKRFRQLQGAPIQLADMMLQWDNATPHVKPPSILPN